MAPRGNTGRRGQPGKGLEPSGQGNPRIGYGDRVQGWGCSDPQLLPGDFQEPLQTHPPAELGLIPSLSSSRPCYPKPAEPGSPPGPSPAVQGWAEPIQWEIPLPLLLTFLSSMKVNSIPLQRRISSSYLQSTRSMGSTTGKLRHSELSSDPQSIPTLCFSCLSLHP